MIPSHPFIVRQKDTALQIVRPFRNHCQIFAIVLERELGIAPCIIVLYSLLFMYLFFTIYLSHDGGCLLVQHGCQNKRVRSFFIHLDVNNNAKHENGKRG
jgi:hypothetical protein